MKDLPADPQTAPVDPTAAGDGLTGAVCSMYKIQGEEVRR